MSDVSDADGRTAGTASSRAEGVPSPVGATRGSYVDFEVEVGPGVGRQYPVAVIRSPAGEARGTMVFPYDDIALDNRLKDLQVALLRSGGARRKVLSPEEAGVRGFGQDMFDALLAGDARSRYDVSCREARQLGLGLRVKLRIRPPELARLPWEYLFDGRVGEYMCLSRDTPVVRFLESPQSIQPLAVEPPLRILAMIVSPSDLTELDTERERERIERALAPVQRSGLAELVWMYGDTWRDLQRAMRSGPWHVFHFVGHGGFDSGADEGVIALSDERGEAHRLLATEVGRLLADHHSLRLVVLNACEGARSSQKDVFSSTAAVLVRRGLPAVLAMQHEITDRAAIEFARAFYEALGEGLPVDAAVSEARKAVSLAVTNTIEWGTPVLYMRTADGVIFDVPESARREATPPGPPDRRDEVLGSLYTEALSAYWVGDWALASDRLSAIVAEAPDYADAGAKLAEAKQRLAWDSLHAQATAAHDEGDLATGIGLLEQLAAEAPEYPDVLPFLDQWRTQLRLDELVGEARRLHDADQWRAVVAVFAEIHELDPSYADDEGLLQMAQHGVEALELSERLARLYGLAVRRMNASEWEEARDALAGIHDADAEYRETARLLAKCESEIEAIATERSRAEKAAALYEEAAALIQAEQWVDAVAKLDELLRIEPDYPDAAPMRSQAEGAVEIEQAEAAQRRQAATIYAQAVQDLQAGRHQAALDKWHTVHKLDPSFVDHRDIVAAVERMSATPREPPRRRGWWTRAVAAVGVAVVAIVGIVWIASLDSGETSTVGSGAALEDSGAERDGGAAGAIDASGTTVTILTPETGEQLTDFRAVMSEFGDSLGINVEIEGTLDAADIITIRTEAGDPPDIFVFPQPGRIQDFGADGSLVALPDDVLEEVNKNFDSGWIDLGTVGGTVYGVPNKADLKSLVWYSPSAFAAAGYEVPTTWEEMIVISDDIVANGGTPWSAGLGSGTATGWPFTDWMEDVMLRLHGPEVYDQWVSNEIPFNDPQVIETAEFIMDMWSTDGYLQGGPEATAGIAFADAGLPILDGNCFMHRQANFFSQQWPDGTTVGPDGDVNAFYLPTISDDFGKVVLTAGTLMAAFDDRPEVSEVMKFVASTEYAETRGALGGMLFPNLNMDISVYPSDIERVFGEILLAADVSRFDGSDLMPGAIGFGEFWTAAVDIVTGSDITETLTRVQDVWANLE